MKSFEEHHKEFCTEIQKWIDGGEEPAWFRTKCGLCNNFINYLAFQDYNAVNRYDFSRHFHGLLIREYGQKDYPFNPNPDSYDREDYKYNNPLRLAHIKKYAQE